jgi:tetratricopeptide (TPR) repeat protein
MNSLLEQSRAYVALGMIEEARELVLEALRTDYNEEVFRPLLVDLAYKEANFPLAASLGKELLARGFECPHLYEHTALALRHLGQSSEAASLLIRLGEDRRNSWKTYQLACFLSATGDSDEAVRHLLISLPAFRSDREKTWTDGDIKMLWAKLAEGDFELETAHRLNESEFDTLREWRPDAGTKWTLDPANYSALPDELRAVMRFDPDGEAYVLDYHKAPAFSKLAKQFENWTRSEVFSNQQNFDCARRIAWEHVLNAQPQYALAAWQRRDLCAVRHHFMWSLANDPYRIRDFGALKELAPLIEECSRMIDSDRNFFSKQSHAHLLHKSDPETALEILDSLPDCWRTHPLLTQIRGHCLENLGLPKEGLACLLSACDHSPQDAAYFLNAAGMALRQGWKDIATTLMGRAPASAQRYKMWLRLKESLDSGQPCCNFPIREFRGQPDLGGHLLEENGALIAGAAVETS